MKTVKIFKKSVPIWVLIIALLTVGTIAWAAFTNLFGVSADGVGAEAPAGALVMDDCYVAFDGTLDSCTLVGQDITMSMSALQPESVAVIKLTYTPAVNDQYFMYIPIASPPPGISDDYASIADFTWITAGTPQSFDIMVEFETLSPGEILSYTLGFEFHE